MEEWLKWLGYLEHKDERLLGVYQANPGKGGYTIFAEIIRQRYGRNFQGFAWCAVFVHAVLNRPDLLGKPHPGTRVLQRRMKRRGYWKDGDYQPEVGDLIFCGNTKNKRVFHVGIIIEVRGNIVVSIDGNTVDPSGVFSEEDGGAVALRERRLNDPIIFGYGAIGKYVCGSGEII